MTGRKNHSRSRPARLMLASLAILGGITAVIGRPGPAGASTTVSMVADINGLYGGGGSSYPSDLTAVGSKIFFFANDGTNDIQLWSSDGTPGGTTKLSSAGDTTTPGFSSAPLDMMAVGNEAYFVGNQTLNGSPDCGLWKSDGTVSGTQEVINTGTICSAQSMVDLGGHLYFEINQSGAGPGELWTSDGTAGGTVAVTNIGNPTCDIDGLYFYTGLFVDGSEMYFGATNDCNSGDQLWKSDGTSAGTVPVSSLATDVSGLGLDPQNFGAVGSEIYFMGTDGSSNATPPGHDWQLWKSDGSTVQMVTDAAVGSGGWEPEVLTTVGTNLYFQTADATNGFQIWKDDTLNSDALTKVTNIDQTTATLQSQMTAFGNALYFSVTSSDPTAQGLWSYDGSTMTQLTSEQNWTLTPTGSLLFFIGDDSTSSTQIWQSDGTATGTVQDSSINPSYGGSSAQYLTPVGSVLFFSADDGINGQELWKADPSGSGGTTDTTPPMIGFQQSPNGSNGWFTTAPARVTVTASDSASGVKSLSCTTDGSPSSTTPNGTDSFVVSTSTDGAHTVDCTASDNAGNTAQSSTPLDLDTHSPVVSYGTSCPPASGVYLNSVVSANWTASDPTPGSGLASTATGSQNLSTAAVGPKSVTAPSATDVAGNTGMGPTCNYVVQYVLNVSSPAAGSAYKHKATVPITATLTDVNGIRISDAAAQNLASACLIKASGSGAQMLASSCMTYSTKTHSFSAKWRLGNATGAASVTVTVSYSGTPTATMATNNFTIS